MPKFLSRKLYFKSALAGFSSAAEIEINKKAVWMTNHRKGEGERRGELAVMLGAVIAVIQQK